nr:uncharacterized protein LOC109172327 [Ipomoea batatas]
MEMSDSCSPHSSHSTHPTPSGNNPNGTASLQTHSVRAPHGIVQEQLTLAPPLLGPSIMPSTGSQQQVRRAQVVGAVNFPQPSAQHMGGGGMYCPEASSSKGLKLTYLDRFEFKGRKIERTAPAITTWTEEAVKKRIKSEILSGQFGRGKVIPQFQMEEKQVPEQIAEKEWKVTSVLRKMADTEFEFAEVMAEIGNTRTGGGIIKKTFENIAGMINVMSCSQPPPQEGLLDDDDIFNQQSFLDAVSALEQAFMQTTKNYPAQPTQPTTL